MLELTSNVWYGGGLSIFTRIIEHRTLLNFVLSRSQKILLRSEWDCVDMILSILTTDTNTSSIMKTKMEHQET